jgi:hypothetical protein
MTPRKTFTPSTTDNRLMRPGEIYLAKFPFGDTPGMKIRPVLLLIDRGHDGAINR